MLGLDPKGRGVDLAAVQRSCRNILKALHPDVANRRGVLTPSEMARLGNAAERVKAARQRCEEFLSGAEPPPPVQRLHLARVLNTTPGSREFLLRWKAPEPSKPSRQPVKRFVVNAVDPKFNMREVMIASLEPNFDEESGRYLDKVAWTEYIFSERKLDKMPQLFQQPVAELSVACTNPKGSSPRATLKIPMPAFATGKW